MYKKILLAYDGSESGQKALLDCNELAQWADATVSLAAVAPLSLPVVGMEGGVYDTTHLEHQREKYAGILSEGLRRLATAGRSATGEVLLGDTVDEITRHAVKISADLIVVGHRHHDSWATRWWKGSVSKSLIEHSPCSVLVVITR